MENIIYPLRGLLETLGWLVAVGFVAWLFYRYKLRENERRTELMMQAMERGDNTEELLQSLQKPRRSIRERAAFSRAVGLGFTILGGAGLVVSAIFAIHMVVGNSWCEDVFGMVGPLAFLSLIPLSIGIGFVIYSHLLLKGSDSDKAKE